MATAVSRILSTALLIALFNSAIGFISHGKHGRKQPLVQPIVQRPSCFVTSVESTNSAVINNGKDEKKITSGQPRLESDVHVYDGAFSQAACEEIHELALEHCVRGNDGSSIFIRPPHNDKPLTPLENAIDSALSALSDTSRKVEYWSRDEFMNIDAHADIDEVQLEEDGVLRCPEVGHVLYLQVKEGLKGPTCVFPSKINGWGEADDRKRGTSNVNLVMVPAVQGRILKFPGGAMHCVPRPANRWLLTNEEEKNLRIEEQEDFFDDDDDEEWLDDDDDDDDETYDDVERSVLLFNTWPDDELPPRGINGDYATGALPGGIELDSDDDASYAKFQEVQRLAEWEEDYGVDSERIRCNPISDWQEVQLNIGATGEAVNTTNVEEAEIRINLMGKRTRRVHQGKTAWLAGPTATVLKALKEATEVTQFNLIE